VCPAGYFVKDNVACEACPEGSFKAVAASNADLLCGGDIDASMWEAGSLTDAASAGITNYTTFCHMDTSCDSYASCAVGHVRVTSALADSQGRCDVCPAGTFKDTQGVWDTECTPHNECEDGYWSDPETEILTANEDRQCAPHRDSCDAGQYLDESVPATAATDIMCHAIKDECDGVTMWESAAATRTSDRECVKFSAECIQDKTYEAVAGSAYADRDCAPVNVCNAETHFMSSPPTPTRNTECTLFKDCSPLEDNIIVKPSDAYLESSRWPGVSLYTVDRSCSVRLRCDDFWQTVTATDEYQEQCEDIKTTTYQISVTGLTLAQAATSTMDEWKVRLEDKVNEGTDPMLVDDADGFASGLDFRVKNVVFDSSNRRARSEDGGDGTIVSYFVVGFDSSSRRARRSRIGRQSDDGVVLGDAEELPEGTTQCADTEDALCCIAGYGADADGSGGSTCTACANGEYSVGETMQSADATGVYAGCLTQPECGLDQTPQTYYRSTAMTTTYRAVDNCAQLTSCRLQGKLVSQQPTDGQDRQCGGDIAFCDNVAEYWQDAATFDATNREWESSPSCATMATCAVGELWTNPAANRIETDDVDGTVLKFQTAQRNCAARQGCLAGEYHANPLQVAAEGENSVVDNDCRTWTVCTDDEYQTMEPTLVDNRICVALDVCNSNEYMLREATTTSNRECRGVEDCPSGQYQLQAATATENRECSVWAECNVESEYQCTEPSGTADRGCCDITDCADSEVQTAAPTATSNRECAPFGCQGLYYKYDTLGTTAVTKLRMCNSRWTSCASAALRDDSVCLGN